MGEKKIINRLDIGAMKAKIPNSRSSALADLPFLSDLLPEGTPEFWEEQYINSKTSRVAIEMFSFVQFLEFNGFRKVIDRGETKFVRLENNIIEETSIAEMKDFLVKTLTSVYQKEKKNPQKVRVGDRHTLAHLLQYVYKSATSVFEKGKMEMIRTLGGEQYSAGKFSNSFFFRDCWVYVTSEGVTIQSYDDLPNDVNVWQSQVIDFDLIPHKHREHNDDCQFKEFIKLITGKDDKARERMMRGAIGYLMHPFFEGALRAVLLTDVGSSLSKANGRTGKGMIAQAMKEMVSTSIVPAKKWRSDDSFNFQRVTQDNKLVVLDDMQAGFQADSLYNVITEGVAVNKKFQSEFDIRAKILVNSNTMMKGDGDSTRGRFLEIEVDNFFSAKHKPIDHFGNNFFSITDWSQEEWGAFYWYMINCSQLNLADSKAGHDCGVQYVESESIERKRTIQNIDEEFFLFMEGKMAQWYPNDPNKRVTDMQRRFVRKELRDEFLTYKGDTRYPMGIAKLKEKLLDYCAFKKYKLDLDATTGNVERFIIRKQPELDL